MNFFKNIPASMNALLMVMGALAPLVFIAGASHPQLMNRFLVAYLIIGAIAGLGVITFERRKKKKSKEFSDDVQSNASSAEGIRDPNMIAQMDHMRKEFQRGIDIYQKHGKSLYSLPWYVVVGESESGKTEMIRRSEIGFPDKLQDRWQGSGGTLSMHWWFTNKAVILDTAGRLFVSEGAEGNQSQWTNFLQMLKKNRPDCPINGLIMVIPANRLLHHPDPNIEAQSVSDLDRNAGQIARQMETISNELGISFPVYIMITKMDKVKGFREFFADVDKAEDRYQMLGWSNPAQVGDKFDPQSVADYMNSVSERLNRRMMTSLRDVEPAEPQGIRINEVDSLYAFPVSFQSMAPKLTRYLRHIFTSDEWSNKPPFLRGIYFTSALQQGTVLDEALAAAMGVTFDKMVGAHEDDGMSLSKNRTYFVRDLFLDKIFQEKGLVSTTGKMKSKISGWKFWAPAMTLAAIVLFGLIGLFSITSENEVKQWNTLWQTDDGSKDQRILPLVRWENDAILPTDPKESVKMLRTLGKLGSDVQGKPKLGWVFKPAQLFDRNLATARKDVYAELVADTLAQLENTIELHLTNLEPSSWTDKEWQALHALVILRHGTSAEAGQYSENASNSEKSKWDKEGLPDKGLSGNKWQSGKLDIDDSQTWKTIELYQALLTAAEVEGLSPTHLDFCVSRALKLNSANFPTILNEHRKLRMSKNDTGNRDDSFNQLVKKMLPKADMLKQKDYIDRMNALAKGLVKATNYGDFITACKQLPAESETVLVDENASSDEEEEDISLAENKESFAAAILSAETLKEQYNVIEVEPGALERDAELLHEDPKVMKHIRVMNEVFQSPGTLENQFAEFMQELGNVCQDPENKKTIISKFGKLDKHKEAWLKDVFIPQEFHKYLRLPFVLSGRPPSSENEVVFMYKINEKARGFYKDADVSKYEALANSMAFFIDKIENNKVVFHSLKIKPIAPPGINTFAGKITIHDEAQKELANFDFGAVNVMQMMPFNWALPMKSFSVRADGAEVSKIGPWEILDKIEISNQSKWEVLCGPCILGITNDQSFELLKNRPSVTDFKP